MSLHQQIMDLRANPIGVMPAWRPAYMAGHYDARHAAAELALKADAVIEAARAVLVWRHDTPTTGYLRDNDQSREALVVLSAAVAALK